MTILQLRSRLLIIVIVLGLVGALIGGLIVGLRMGWLAWPVQKSNVDASRLNLSSQDEFIVLTASDFAFDQDLDRAKQRLAQLHEAKIDIRLAALAKQYAAEGKPYASYVAALAVALGSYDSEIALIATAATPTATDRPAPTATGTPLTPTTTPTVVPTARNTPAHTPTRRPVATATTQPAAIAPTNWNPGFPAGWPSGVSFEPASVAPGQKYWHLTQALFCDIKDTRPDCVDLPGGIEGIGVYVTLAGGKAPLVPNGGSTENLEDKSEDPECQCTYEVFPDGKPIQVGNFPSDKMSGLALKSVTESRPQTHVRYFLTFQLVTR